MSRGRRGAGRAPRLDAGAVVPVGRGQNHALAHAAWRRTASVELSISATTRPQRPAEVDGRDYHFVTRARFDEMVRNDELLEWAEVFGNRYGTPRAPVEAALERGHDVLFDIDWQGTQQLRDKVAKDFVSVFLLPPSIPELERRLTTRAQDSDEVIRGRMAKASDEMSHWAEYDYVLVNRDIDETFAQVQAILLGRTAQARAPAGSSRTSCADCRLSCSAGPLQGARQRDEAFHRNLLRTLGCLNSRFRQQCSGIGAEGSQALPQHLPALAEGCFGDALQHAGGRKDSGARAGHELYQLKTSPSAAARMPKARCRTGCGSLRAMRSAPRAGHRSSIPAGATMRSATSRWNISTSESYQGGQGSADEPADEKRRRDIVGKVGDDPRRLAVQLAAPDRIRAHRLRSHSRRPG